MSESRRRSVEVLRVGTGAEAILVVGVTGAVFPSGMKKLSAPFDGV